jgi:hypothetical protein
MGSSSSKASREAARAEEARRQAIKDTQGRIEGIFSAPEREADIQDFINATQGSQQLDLDRSKGINDRQLKFAMARSGQAGGSTDIDLNQNLSEDYLRAVVEASRRAQSAGASVRSADQDAKYSLFNQAATGLDMTTATSNALQATRQNIDFAKNVSTEQNFDNFFSDYADLFTTSRKTAGERRQGAEFGTTYGRRPENFSQVAGGAQDGY